MEELTREELLAAIERYEACIADMVRDIQMLEEKLASRIEQDTNVEEKREEPWRHVIISLESVDRFNVRMQVVDFLGGVDKLSPVYTVKKDEPLKYGVRTGKGIVNVFRVADEGGEMRLISTIKLDNKKFEYMCTI